MATSDQAIKKEINESKNKEDGKDGKEIDLLDEDPVISGQEWICVSFLSPEGLKNCKIRGVKFRGAFPTYEAAKKHADKLNKTIDPDFHIFVGQSGKWLPWDPDPSSNSVENQEYREKELNKLMKSYKKNLQKKEMMEAERKKDLLKQAQEVQEAEKHDSRSKTQARLRQKLLKRQQEKAKTKTVNEDGDKKIEKIIKDEKLEQEKIMEEGKKVTEEILRGEPKEDKIKETPKDIKQLEKDIGDKKVSSKEKSKEIEQCEKKCDETTKDVDDISNNIAKLQDLYKKLKNKK